MIRHALKDMGLSKLIGHGKQHLVPPASENEERLIQRQGNKGHGAKGQGKGQRALTRHSGLSQFKNGKKPASKGQNKGNANTKSKSTGNAKNKRPAGKTRTR